MSTIHSVNIGGSLYNVADSSNLAPIETTMTASRAYEIGRFLVLKDGLLYRTKTAIAQGDAFVINTNVERKTFDEVYSSDMKVAVNNATVNMLNPSLNNWSDLGITVVRNSNNTYTITGTYTGSERKILSLGASDRVNFENGKTYRLTGIPTGAGAISIRIGNDSHMTDEGNGATGVVTLPVNGGIKLYVDPGFSAPDGVTLKPMITTNLSANYNDYVPYTGNTGKLSGDVANIRKDVITTQNNVNSLQSALNTTNGTVAQHTDDIAELNTETSRIDNKVIFTDTGNKIVAGNVYNSAGTGENVTYRDILDTTSNNQTLRTWFSSAMKFGMERYIDGALQEGWFADLRKIPFLFYPNSNDLNAITNYSCGWINGNAVNMPSGSSLYGIVITFGVDLDATLTAIQLWVDSENRFYGRIKVGSTWKVWRSL